MTAIFPFVTSITERSEIDLIESFWMQISAIIHKCKYIYARISVILLLYNKYMF